MNTRMHHLSRLGALLALAFGAAHVHAQTTYTVPLAFNITLEAPVCSLTVSSTGGSSTVDKDTVGAASAVTVNLTPTPLAVKATPVSIVNSMSNLVTWTADGPGLNNQSAAIQRKMQTPPTATAKCTNNTVMKAKISKNSTTTHAGLGTMFMAGTAGGTQTVGALPIGVVMGLAKFGDTNGTYANTTLGSMSTVAELQTTATGSDQALEMTVALYAKDSTTALTTGYTGLWTYSFNINLEF